MHWPWVDRAVAKPFARLQHSCCYVVLPPGGFTLEPGQGTRSAAGAWAPFARCLVPPGPAEHRW